MANLIRAPSFLPRFISREHSLRLFKHNLTLIFYIQRPTHFLHSFKLFICDSSHYFDNFKKAQSTKQHHPLHETEGMISRRADPT